VIGPVSRATLDHCRHLGKRVPWHCRLCSAAIAIKHATVVHVGERAYGAMVYSCPVCGTWTPVRLDTAASRALECAASKS